MKREFLIFLPLASAVAESMTDEDCDSAPGEESDPDDDEYE